MTIIKGLETKELVPDILSGKQTLNVQAFERAAELARKINTGDDSETTQDEIWREAQQVAEELTADLNLLYALRGELSRHFGSMQLFAGGEYFKRMREVNANRPE